MIRALVVDDEQGARERLRRTLALIPDVDVIGEACEGAEAIARGVERGARTVMAPRSGWLFVLAERLFPSLVDAQLAASLHDV